MLYLLNKKTCVKRYFFLKEHKAMISDKSKPVGRTVLVLAVPPYCTKASLEFVKHQVSYVGDRFFHNLLVMYSCSHCIQVLDQRLNNPK